MIYAIRCVNTNFIKFGRANNVGRRLKELDTCCPFDLEITAVVNWPDGSETAIHRHLQDQRLKGEWFQDSDTTQRVIGWMLQGVEGLEELRLVNKVLFKHRAMKIEKNSQERYARLARARDKGGVRDPFDMATWRAERAAKMRG